MKKAFFIIVPLLVITVAAIFVIRNFSKPAVSKIVEYRLETNGLNEFYEGGSQKLVVPVVTEKGSELFLSPSNKFALITLVGNSPNSSQLWSIKDQKKIVDLPLAYSVTGVAWSNNSDTLAYPYLVETPKGDFYKTTAWDTANGKIRWEIPKEICSLPHVLNGFDNPTFICERVLENNLTVFDHYEAKNPLKPEFEKVNSIEEFTKPDSNNKYHIGIGGGHDYRILSMSGILFIHYVLSDTPPKSGVMPTVGGPFLAKTAIYSPKDKVFKDLNIETPLYPHFLAPNPKNKNEIAVLANDGMYKMNIKSADYILEKIESFEQSLEDLIGSQRKFPHIQWNFNKEKPRYHLEQL